MTVPKTIYLPISFSCDNDHDKSNGDHNQECPVGSTMSGQVLGGTASDAKMSKLAGTSSGTISLRKGLLKNLAVFNKITAKSVTPSRRIRQDVKEFDKMLSEALEMTLDDSWAEEEKNDDCLSEVFFDDTDVIDPYDSAESFMALVNQHCKASEKGRKKRTSAL